MNPSMSLGARGWVCWPLAAILVPVTLARLAGLDRESFWLDEGKGASLALLPLDTWWRALPEHHAPPGHFLLLRWIGALSVEDSVLRLPSALCGVLAILLFWRLVSHLVQGRVALTALAWLAFSPLLFHYSQEARPYAAWVLAELAVVHALFVPDSRNTATNRITLLGLLLPLPLLLHYQALWFFVGRLPTLIWLMKGWRKEHWKAFSPAFLLSLSLTVPWLLHQIVSMPPPNPRALVSAADWTWVSLPRSLGEYQGLPPPPPGGARATPGRPVGGLLTGGGSQGRDRFPRSVWILSLGIPPVGIIGSIFAEERYLATRHFLPLLPLLLMEGAKGLHLLVERWITGFSPSPQKGRWILPVFGILSGVPCLLWGGMLLGDHRRIDHPPCREIARFLEEEHLPEQAYLAVGDNVSVLDYYRQTRRLSYTLFLDTLAGAAPASGDRSAEMGPTQGLSPTDTSDGEIQGIVVAGDESGGREWREALARKGIRPSMSWTSRTISPVEYYRLPAEGGRLLVEGVEQEIRPHP